MKEIQLKLKKISEYIYELPKHNEMIVPGRVYGDKEIINHLMQDIKEGKEWNSLMQMYNVACLPGIQRYSLAMPDIHPGYGFPIGGVGAFDTEKGVISVAGVGFDINCISGESKVLHEHGYTKRIKDFRNDFQKQKIICVNPASKVKETPIRAFMKFRPKTRVYKVKTESGKEIIATGEHPFFTPKGMVMLKDITFEKLSVYPFEGVEYKEPQEKLLVYEKKIKKCRFIKDKQKIIANLKKKSLFPLKTTNEKLPLLLKIAGYVLGDGTAYFTKGKGTIWFYGKEEDLETIRKDVAQLGFTPSKIYFRTRKHNIPTKYGLVKFTSEECSFKTTSSSLAALLWALGFPLNNKTEQDFTLPNWLMKLPKWQKRLFLAAFFGAELSSPSTIPANEYNFQQPILSINKKINFLESGRQFLKQIRSLLQEFSVKSELIKERAEYINKNQKISIRLRLVISNTSKNLINLWSKIGFEYNKKRRYLANGAIQYLKLKENIILERENSILKSKELHKKGIKSSLIYKQLKSKYVNKRFIERSLYGKRKTSSRVAFNFIGFKDFLEENTAGLGMTGQVWDNLISKEKIDFQDFVYDFNVEDEHHNFIANNFIVSNCGVRTLTTPLMKEDIEKDKQKLADVLYETIPAGLGSTGDIRLTKDEIDEVLVKGAEFAVAQGYGFKEDLKFIEENGRIANAKPANVSDLAKRRQFKQVGTLGSGNHYLEVQYVDEVYDEKAASVFGLKKGQILVSLHCGSRALGHQIGTDYLKELEAASKKYKIPIREKELVCAPFSSPEGQKYYTAINCGINCAFANRQALAHLTRTAFNKALAVEEKEIKTFYEIGHNTAKLEEHTVDGKKKKLIVHRKGATRAFGPGRKEVTDTYRKIGQPVIIGGTMGTSSFILHGTTLGMEETFGSACHGAGRIMSRHQAKNEFWGENIIKELAKKGIVIRGHSKGGVAEEAPGAYKDVEEVINVMHNSGIAKKVVRMKPLISIKG